MFAPERQLEIPIPNLVRSTFQRSYEVDYDLCSGVALCHLEIDPRVTLTSVCFGTKRIHLCPSKNSAHCQVSLPACKLEGHDLFFRPVRTIGAIGIPVLQSINWDPMATGRYDCVPDHQPAFAHLVARPERTASPLDLFVHCVPHQDKDRFSLIAVYAQGEDVIAHGSFPVVHRAF